MKTFAELGTEIGELVERKNAAYGNSIAVAGDVLALLYPDGLKPEQYADALLMVRIIDKQKRIATNNDPSGESPFTDIAGYGILGAHLHEQRKASALCSVRGTAAPISSSLYPSDSALKNAETLSFQSAAALSARTSTSEPSAIVSREISAPAAFAITKSAKSSADVPPGLEEKVWKKINRTDGCWLWLGARWKKGYGRVNHNYHPYVVHRIVWQLVNGPIPQDQVLRHSCSAKHCANPSHLYLAVRDAPLRTCGENHPGAKITDAQVAQIACQYAEGDTPSELASRFGVSRRTISRIVSLQRKISR